MDMESFQKMGNNEDWIIQHTVRELEPSYRFTDIEVYDRDDLLIAKAKELELDIAYRKMAPIYTPGSANLRTAYGGELRGIEWVYEKARGSYDNGAGTWISGQTLRWKDGEAKFSLDTTLGFHDDRVHHDFTIARIGGSLYSTIEQSI